MKICIISTAAIESDKKGYKGTERIAWQMADWFGKKHEVTLVAAKGSEKGNFELIETVNPGYTISGFIEREEEHIIEAVEILKDKDFDLVQVHQNRFYLETFWVKSKAYEWHIHGWLPPYPPNTRIVCYARSKSHMELLKQRFGEKFKVDYMYNFIDISEFPFVKEKKDYLLFFNRMSPEKGANNFVKLAKELGFKGIVAGEDSLERGIDPNYLIELLKEISRVKNVDYYGAVDEKTKIELLSKAKALIIPYNQPYFEIFGIILVEALACGTPVFTYKGFGGPDEIITQECGYLAKSYEDLRNALKKFLNGELYFEPEKCRERVEQNFDINVVLEEYEKKLKINH